MTTLLTETEYLLAENAELTLEIQRLQAELDKLKQDYECLLVCTSGGVA